MLDFVTFTTPLSDETLVPALSGFTAGTLIVTPRGEVAVEALKVGDKVLTRDNGLRTVRQINDVTYDKDDLRDAPHLGAVHIAKGALGSGMPERDLIVSPAERILIVNDSAFALFEEREVLVAAEDLVGRKGITWAKAESVRYVGFALDDHEVILANGIWAESLDPADLARSRGDIGPVRRKLGAYEAAMLAV